MNLSDQVCSLELAKRLQRLGVKQESLFCWLTGVNTEECFLYPNQPCFPDSNWRESNHLTPSYGYSAFTVAELGAILPKEIYSDYKNYSYELNCKWELHYSDNKMWHITYIRYNDQDVMDFIIYDLNEANARAKMLIYLIENGLIENKKSYIPPNAYDLVMEKPE